jgi:hypothetical protein
VTQVETYLASIAAQVRGAGTRRLRAEVRDHLDDAIADHAARGCDPTDAARIALERLGPAGELVVAWNARADARRVRRRRRAALVAFAAATASALALVQHASGRQPSDGGSPPAATPQCSSAGQAAERVSCLSRVGRTAYCRRGRRCR